MNGVAMLDFSHLSCMCNFLDEGGMGGRTQSLDSIDAEDEDEREIPVKKKKRRPLEESADTGKKTEKLQRRQHVEKGSSEGADSVGFKCVYFWLPVVKPN